MSWLHDRAAGLVDLRSVYYRSEFVVLDTVTSYSSARTDDRGSLFVALRRVGMPDRRGMITHVTVSRELLLIGEAALLVCVGLLTWRLSRRKRELPSGPALLVGLPGLYLATLPSFYDAPRWLYIPGLVLFLSSYLIQVVVWRRQRVNSTAGPPGTDGSV